MNVLIFGATGATGKHLVQESLKKRLVVTIFTRDPSKWTGSRDIRVLKGDVRDAAAVAEAIKGQDWILIALGADSLGKTDLLERAATNIVCGMKEHHVRRVVVLGAAGALHSAIKYQPIVRKLLFGLISKTFLKNALRDSGRQERIFETSGLDYTVVHPPRLLNSDATGDYRELMDALPPRASAISRADVAEYMVKILPDKTYYGTGPYIAN